MENNEILKLTLAEKVTIKKALIGRDIQLEERIYSIKSAIKNLPGSEETKAKLAKYIENYTAEREALKEVILKII